MIITPKTKVGELLDSFPDLEPVLMAMSPSFEKLKNPVLRRTVARVATLQQIAVVGGIPVDDIVKKLRKEAGQAESGYESAGNETPGIDPPQWFDKGKIRIIFNATPVINSGDSPMAGILERTNALLPGDIMELHTPFMPAPILDKLKEKNFLIWTTQNETDVITYITKG